MQEQLEILRRRPARFTVPPERGEPLVWIERCVIWSAPGDVVRDIRFRRGLNIIYSPDPGDDRSDPRGRALGHAAGKTLLCRLLRYCLGESNFGPPSVRRRVAQVMPDAYVGIQARVAGQTWSVARPLGTRHREFARAGTPVESVLSTPPEKLDVFWDQLDAAVMRPVREVVKLRHDLNWVHVLAWLARDQESRFAHPLAWRASAAESESPVLGMPQEVLAYAVRVLLGLMTSDESIEQDRLSAVLEEKDRARNMARQLRAELARLAARVLGANRVSVAGILPTPLEGNRLVAQAEEAVRKLKEELATFEASSCRDREAQRDALLSDVGAIRAQLASTEAEATAISQLLSRVATEASLTAEAVKMRLGTDTCPVCKVPIDEALAKGCALAERAGGASQRHNDSWREAEHRAQQERLALLDREAQRIRELETQRTAAFASADAELRLWREKKAAGRADVLRRLEEAQRDLWAAQRVDEAVRELEDASKRAEDLEGAARSHREALQSIRQAGSSNAQRLRELLTDVVANVLDGTAAAELVFELRDVFARVAFAGELGGVAGEALKTWAFDVAAMVAAAEGRTSVPALLIHDSPREGDLGLSHYHKYFRYVAGLEHRLGGAAFQYIVSTTTSPPDEIADAGHIVLQLNGGTANDRLLRVNL